MDPRTVYLMLAFVSTAIGTITNENIKEGITNVLAINTNEQCL